MKKKLERSPETVECRSFPLSLRAAREDKEELRLTGHAAVFDTVTVLVRADYWWKGSPEIREVIERGAFSKSIAEADQRAFWNHSTDLILGRRKNGTLNLREDERGLFTEITPPDTALIRDMVIAPIERGDVNQMSFGFRVIREKVEEEESVITIRLKEIELIEVSPVAIPAYPQTDIGISARSAERLEDFRQQRQAAIQSAPGLAAHPENEEPESPTPAEESHPEQSAPAPVRHLDDALFMRLDLAKRGLRIAA